MKKIFIGVIVLVLLAILFILVGNAGDNESISLEGQTMNQLVFDDLNLEPLAVGHYEGWAVFGEEKVSTGVFDTTDNLTFTSDRNLALADVIAITIEPEGDDDDIPSGVIVLAGDVTGSRVDLTFPVDVSNVSGSYILATPSDGENNNEDSGVWFVNIGDELTPSLTLPTLPEGWKYEGWAVNNDQPLTTGRFVSASGADEFDGYSGDEGVPPFPGEDFIRNAPNGITFPIMLSDGDSKVVVSIEPDINGVDPTGDGPFQVKPLHADVAAGATDHTSYSMELDMSSVPSGIAVLQ